jgi:hypothetical protein
MRLTKGIFTIFFVLGWACLAQAHSQALFNVRDYGAAGDGVRLDTDAINKAIQTAAVAGGGTVLVPAGKYLSGTIRLQSNITLWIDAGAAILGSRNLADYQLPQPDERGWNEDSPEWYFAIVLARGTRNVAIMGKGTIDGQKLTNPKGEQHIRGPHGVLIYDSKDVTIRDVTLKDIGNYNVIVRSAERLNLDGLTALGGYDGINMRDVRNVTISNCRLFTGDDSLAGDYWENVTVSNCILNTSCNAMRVGGRNVLVNNCVIYGGGEYVHLLGFRRNTESGFQIWPHEPPRGNPAPSRLVKPGPVDNVVLSNITMINVRSPLYVVDRSNSLGVGRIIIDNLTVLDSGRTPFFVDAPRENPARSVIVRNARMSFAGGVDEQRSNGQAFSPYSMLQSYAFYCRNVEHMELHDVRVDYKDKDFRPALIGENIGSLELDRFMAQREPYGPPSLLFAGIRQLLIDGKEPPAAQVLFQGLDLPSGTVYAGEPFLASATVQNAGPEGLGEVPLRLGEETVTRTILLKANEKTQVRFINMQSRETGEIPVQVGSLAKKLTVRPRPAGGPVSPPYLTFKNLEGQVEQIQGGFYIRAAGDYFVLDHGDQYATAYQAHALPSKGSVVVKVENPDMRGHWVGRVGIIVRNDITKPGQAAGYLVLGAQPSNGYALEWDSNGDGRIDKRTELDGYTDWPCWLKLERDGNRLTGYSSRDGVNWTKVGEAEVPTAEAFLDAGVFAHRSSARFLDLKISQ